MKRVSFILVAFLFLVNACAPNVEGETKSWDKNVKAMTAAKADYPSFSDAIDQKLTEAKGIWEEAKGISEEDAKAEKMRTANNLLSSGCVGNLVSMKSKIKTVETSLDKVQSLQKGKEGESKRYAKDAIEDAEKAITMAKNSVKGNSCEDVERAFKKLGLAATDLTTAITKINAADKEEQVKKDSSKVDANNTTTEKKIEEPKMVKCPYCDTKNEAKNSKCKSCGANL